MNNMKIIVKCPFPMGLYAFPEKLRKIAQMPFQKDRKSLLNIKKISYRLKLNFQNFPPVVGFRHFYFTSIRRFGKLPP